MITYDWKTVWMRSEGSSAKILDIIDYLAFRPIPENIYDPVIQFTEVDWSGISYIINPKPILEYRIRRYEKELAEYVALASFRSLAEFKVTKRTTLPVLASPIPVEDLIDNRFLSLESGNIHFRWEETIH